MSSSLFHKSQEVERSATARCRANEQPPDISFLDDIWVTSLDHGSSMRRSKTFRQQTTTSHLYPDTDEESDFDISEFPSCEFAYRSRRREPSSGKCLFFFTLTFSSAQINKFL